VEWISLALDRGAVASSCESGDDSLDYIKGGEFLD